MTTRTATALTWLLLAPGLAVLAACTNPQPTDPTSTSATTTATPSGSATATSGSAPASTSPSIDPRAQPAVDAFLAYARTSDIASKNPLPLGSTYPPEADFTRYSFDPVKTDTEVYFANLANQNVRFRGTTPPVPRLHVTSIELNATPYPKVVLTSCEIPGPDWDAYDSQGNRVPDVSTSVPPPYLITATMIYYKEHWGLQDTTADQSRTCTG